MLEWAVGWVPPAGLPCSSAVPSETGARPSPTTRSGLGDPSHRLRQQPGPSAALPLPPQLVNRHVYSGSADRTVKCWLADTGECVRTFAAHRHSVSALRYHAGTCK